MGIKQYKESGMAHIAVLVVIIVVAAAGFAGWWVWHNQQKKDSNSVGSKAVQDAIKNAKCDYNDKDLCKFFTGWKAESSYSVTSVTKDTNGATSTAVIEASGDTKSHMKLTGATEYETILINDALYTKAGDTWYKQTIPKEDISKYSDKTSSKLPDPTDTSTDTTKAEYKNVGKEKCGDLNCFKYQVVEASNSDTTYIWFDDKDYQLRRTQTTNSDGSSTDSSFSYKTVNITEPSPVKDLQPGQYIVPGQNEPVSTPSDADIQNLLNQYGQ